MLNTKELYERRQRRTRARLARHSGGKPRLTVFRSNQHIYAQIIDDLRGATLCSASTIDKANRLVKGGDREAAAKVGKLIAERALKAGITTVVFDRGAYLFHGRVKALAEAAREGGLLF